jgi:hypothetical protein
MDRNYIDQHHIVARYLAGQLSEEEGAAFEAYYLEHPEIVREMETTARFKAGLLKLRDQGELASLLEQSPPRYWVRAAAIAAGIAAVVVAMIFVARMPDTDRLVAAAPDALYDGSGNRLAVGLSRTLIRTRGRSDDADLVLPEIAQAIELRILPAFDAPSGRYRVALSRSDGIEPPADHEIAGLRAASDGFVVLYLNSVRLAPGRYELTISGEGAGGAKDTFSLQVRATQPRENR